MNPKSAKVNASPIRMELFNMFVELSILENQATWWTFIFPWLHVLFPHMVSHVLPQLDGL